MDIAIKKKYQGSSSRLFLLDYDGVLAEITPRPEDAKPTQEILEVLGSLAADPANTVVIISGRNHADLEAWLGGLPIHFAAEHGLLYKSPGQTWSAADNLDISWKPHVEALFERFVQHLPGSFIEHKTNGMVWHYRQVADQAAAEAGASQLHQELLPFVARHGLRVMLGSKIVETQPVGVSKGTGAAFWLSRHAWEFILAAGDDVTDEDTFAALPPEAFTIKIGDGDSVARHRLQTPADMRALLRSLTSA